MGIRVLQPGDTHVPMGASPMFLSAARIATTMPEDLHFWGFFKFGIVDGCLAARPSLSAIVKDGRVAFRKLTALAKSLSEWSQCSVAGSMGHPRAPHVSVSLGGTGSKEGVWGGHGSGDPWGPTHSRVPGVAP